MKLHRWEDIRAEAAEAPGFEEAYMQAGRELAEELVEYHLAELRRLRKVTQVELARQLGISQPGLSAMEKRGDVQLSTLRDFVQGLGGHLELTAVFDGDVRVPLVLDRTEAVGPPVRTEDDAAEDTAKRTKRANRAAPAPSGKTAPAHRVDLRPQSGASRHR
jgi:transcriptional regulator with XRE-family HTH domain